jgi:hypothetical protein
MGLAGNRTHDLRGDRRWGDIRWWRDVNFEHWSYHCATLTGYINMYTLIHIMVVYQCTGMSVLGILLVKIQTIRRTVTSRWTTKVTFMTRALLIHVYWLVESFSCRWCCFLNEAKAGHAIRRPVSRRGYRTFRLGICRLYSGRPAADIR